MNFGKSETPTSIAVAIVVIGITLGVFLIAMAFKFQDGANGCAGIGAEYKWGRDFSVCVKPDGSLWRVP